MNHPFHWISPQYRSRVFGLCFVAAIVLMATLQILGRPLINDSAPTGIVSFEFAGDLTGALTILDSWDPATKVFAALNLGLDYLFLLAYAGAIGLGCVLLGEALANHSTTLPTIGSLLAWGATLAALLDAFENYALIRLLLGSTYPIWPFVARLAAAPKFTLVALGLLYILFGTIVFLTRRSPKDPQRV
jgi:hypothetical protein